MTVTDPDPNIQALLDEENAIMQERAEMIAKAQEMPVVHEGEKRYAPDGQEIFPVTCPECSKTLLWTSLKGHRREQHHVDSDTNMEFLERIRFDGAYVPKTGRPVATKATTPAQRAKEAKRKRDERAKKVVITEPTPKKGKALDPQQLVEMVLESLYPKGVPVKKLSVVNRWIKATEEFVKEAEL